MKRVNLLDTMSSIINDIRTELKRQADEAVRESGMRFFKEDINLYGVKTAIVRKIGKDFYKEVKGIDKAEIFSMCEELWRSGFQEEAVIACNWSYNIRREYEPDDFRVFERWVEEYVTNWAACDTLCNHTIGAFVQRYPEFLSDLKRWTGSGIRWVRRASAVSLIVPARKGIFLKEIFEIADLLLGDEDDLVQKGYGWMLKVASRAHREEVFDYVMKNKDVMPRTAFRYAIEKMPQEMRKMAMKR